MTRIGFVGAGLIGRERIRAVQMLQQEGRPIVPVALHDPGLTAAAALAAEIGAVCCATLDELIAQGPDWVVVATPHDCVGTLLPPLLAAGINVLVEKPLGRGGAEAQALAALSARPDQVFVGQNYRFFPGVAALLRDVRHGRFGTPVSMRLQLGHGGSPADRDGWKLDPVRAGGGVLIDPGIHLLDLVLQIEQGAPLVQGGTAWRGFWNTGIEEDVHLLLRGQCVPAYQLEVSVVRWRSRFSLEFHGTEGYGVVEGRGRSYGPQIYRRGRRWGWQGGTSQAESEELVVETDGQSVFADEMRCLFFGEDRHGAQPCSLAQALANMALLETCRHALQLPPAPDFPIAS